MTSSSSLELSFPETVRPIDFASIHLSFEEAAVRVDHEVLKEVDNSSDRLLATHKEL